MQTEKLVIPIINRNKKRLNRHADISGKPIRAK